MQLTATVVITTKDRKDELRRAVQSVLSQTVQPELLVYDDGSTDGTSEMVKQEFPGVRLERGEVALGVVRARNKAVRLASNPVVITIDDDCVLVHPGIVEQTIADFTDPRIAIVSMPIRDRLRGDKVYNVPPDRENTYVVGGFGGGSHAVLREVFVSLDGYHGYLNRQGEELDFSLRLLDAGYLIRLGRAEPQDHLESPVRSWAKIVYYDMRNALLIAWWNVPSLLLLPHLAMVIKSQLLLAVGRKQIGASLKGLVAGLVGVCHELRQRKPVSIRSYRLLLKLRKSGGVSIDSPLISSHTKPGASR